MLTLTLILNLIQGIQGIQHPGYEGMDLETSSVPSHSF